MSSAFGEIGDRLERFTDVFTAAATGRPVGVEATPVRRQKAIRQMEKLEVHLTDEEKVNLMDLFTKDIAMCDAYTSIQGEGMRKVWVKRRLEEF